MMGMVFFHALGGVFSLLALVALGYALAARGWFSDSCRKMIPKLVTNVSLPPFLACTIIEHFPREGLGHMIQGAILPFLVMGSLFILAWFCGKLIHVEKKHFGLFCACVSNPNTIFIGIPVNQALFGPQSLPYVLLYYFASTIFFWTIGNYFISRDAPAGSRPKNRTPGWQSIVSPPLLGFFAGICIIGFRLEAPDFIFQAAKLTGSLTTPLALLFIGITLEDMGLGKMRITRDIAVGAAGRMIVSPLFMVLLLPMFDLPPLMGRVFVMQASLPVIMQIAILSAYYNTDPDYGSVMVSFTTVLCAITVPVWMAAIS